MESLDTNGGVPGHGDDDDGDCDGDCGGPADDGDCSGGRRPPKLILYFDLRNTIFVADSITDITPEQALNAYLTGVLWGRELAGGEWRWVSERPTLQCPAGGSTTYYKHLEAALVRKAEDRETLRLAVGDFTQTAIGSAFESHHRRHLELLRWPRSAEASHHKLTLAGVGGQRYHYVLPAFYRTMERLAKDGRKYAIVVRTYGLDCGNVLDSIRHTLAGNHPDFPDLPAMNVRCTPGRVVRRTGAAAGGDGEGGGITVQVLDRKDRVQKEVTGDRRIYEHFCRSAGVTGYVDDFGAWERAGYSHHSAKPLWLDATDTEHRHIFFDDNYRPGMKDSIVDVRLLTAAGGDEAVSLSTRESSAYANVSLVQVDLLECIRNESYFYDRIVECERNTQGII